MAFLWKSGEFTHVYPFYLRLVAMAYHWLLWVAVLAVGCERLDTSTRSQQSKHQIAMLRVLA